jgi:hypothetical protein
LISNTFVTGDTITLADISLWTILYMFFTNVITQASAEKDYPSIVRWFNTLAIQPQFKAVVPNFEFIKVEVFPKGHPSHVDAAAPTKVEEKKAAAPAPEPAAAEPKKVGKGSKAAEPKKAAEPVVAKEEPAAVPASPEPKKGKGKAEAKKAVEPTPASPKIEAKKAPSPEPKAEVPKTSPKKAAEPKAEAPKASPKAQAQPKAKAASGKKK